MFGRARAFFTQLQGPGARAAIGTALIVWGLTELSRFVRDVGEGLVERADELDRLDSLIAGRHAELTRLGVSYPDQFPHHADVDLDVSRETSQDRDGGEWGASGAVRFDVVAE
jgi:hypothetical protein